MTETEVLEKFRRYRWLVREIEHLVEELERIRSARERMTPILSDAPKGSFGDGTMLETGTEKMIQIEERIAGQIIQLTKHRSAIESLLSLLESPKERTLLRMKYIDGMTWEEIEKREYLDERWARRIVGRAIHKIALKSPPDLMIE